METLIELYDDRAIENFLGPETFKPKMVYYICPPEVLQEGVFQQTLSNFYKKRKILSEFEIVESSLYKADKIYTQLIKIVESNKDCVLDVTGGTDAALFAS